MKPDLIVRGGTVIDGTGAPAFTADVAIADGRVAEIGRIPAIEGVGELDADGLTVAPGFIDPHSHSDFTLLVEPRAVSSIAQGVTSEIVGNCGWGTCPIGDPSLATEVIYGFTPDLPITWKSVAGYLERLEEAKPAVNVLTLVPNGQLRLATVGTEQRPAATDELDRMKDMLRQGLKEGAFGYSTGLEYSTEVGATEEEVTELCRVAAAAGGIYATHTRNRDEASVEAVAEAIRTAENAGIPLQISHITPRGGREDTERSIELVDQARARGSDVAFDMHTRLFGTTYLKVLLPFWALEGGKEEIARRLADRETRERMKEHRNLITALGDWNRVVLLDNPAFPEFSRRSFADIAAEMGREPLDAAYDILLAEIDHLHRPFIILHSYTEELLKFTYEHPACLVGSDATALAPDGPLASSIFHGSYTWASWFYRRMVRESETFTPEEGVRKLSGLVAERFGLADRGVIRQGACADFAIFDAEIFGEKGTTFEPNQVAEGMIHVLVNGVPTMTDGRLTGDRAGAVLRR